MWKNFLVSFAIYIFFATFSLLLNRPNYFIFCIPFMFIFILPRLQSAILAFASITFLIFGDSVGWSRIMNTQYWDSLTFFELFTIRTISICSAFAFLFLANYFSFRLLPKSRYRAFIFSFFVMAILLVVGTYFKSTHILFAGFLLIACKMAFYFTFLNYEKFKLRKWQDLFLFLPFWSAVPTVFQPFINKKCHSEIESANSTLNLSLLREKILATQISGAKLFTKMGSLYLLSQITLGLFVKETSLTHFNFVIKPILKFPDFSFWKVPNLASSENFSKFEIWMGFVLAVAVTWTYQALIWTIPVVIARMSGIHLERSVYRPLQSKTFNETWGRIEHYYVAFIKNIYLIPLIQLNIISNKSLNRKFGLFLGITSAGLVYHTILALPTSEHSNIFKLISLDLSNDFAYFSIVAMCVISFGNYRIDEHFTSPHIKTFVRATYSFFCMSIFYLIIFVRRTNLASFEQLIRNLF